MLRKFLQDDTGTTAIEYGFIAMTVSLAALICFVSLGESIDLGFDFINERIGDALPDSDQPPPDQKDPDLNQPGIERTDIALAR